jgi:hypothetical protein
MQSRRRSKRCRPAAIRIPTHTHKIHWSNREQSEKIFASEAGVARRTRDEGGEHFSLCSIFGCFVIFCVCGVGILCSVWYVICVNPPQSGPQGRPLAAAPRPRRTLGSYFGLTVPLPSPFLTLATLGSGAKPQRAVSARAGVARRGGGPWGGGASPPPVLKRTLCVRGY